MSKAEVLALDIAEFCEHLHVIAESEEVDDGEE
jgi:hypothetical protein